MLILLYLLFILSGAAGLMYESVWSRYLGLFVGHSAYAQIIVLTIFLGGMSLGAMLVGQRSERLSQPLRWYAGIEIVVGLIGLFFHDIYGVLTGWAYASLLPAMGSAGGVTAAKWALAGLLILPQSILLGATFPLMSAGVVRIARHRPGRVLAMLYFSNSFGAAMGVLIAGFWLVAAAGLPGTMLAAAIINLVVGVLTIVFVRTVLADDENPVEAHAVRIPIASREPGEGEAVREEVAITSSTPLIPERSHEPGVDLGGLSPRRLWHLLIALAFGTAAASFIYEIAWIRMLSLVLGSATHSFELMLSAFILGIALGALWVHRRADSFRNPLRTLGVVQCIMGAAALATLPLYMWSFDWTVSLLAALDRTAQGYTMYTVIRYAFCLAVMLPATFCAGIVLPLLTRTLVVAGGGEKAIGWVYGWNTLGSIVGVMLAGLVLLPVLGLRNMLIQGAVLDMALGVLLLRAAAGASPERRQLALAAAGLTALAAVMAGSFVRLDHNTLASGVYRYGRLTPSDSRDIIFYADGRTATVTVARTTSDSIVVLATNGKPDASLRYTWINAVPGAPRVPARGDESTQLLLPLIALAHKPTAGLAAVIGHGSGMTSHVLLGSHHVQRVYTIEIEPEMIRGSRHFKPANQRVFDDPRSTFVIDDAKSFFAADRRLYDIIISEPSNPWVSGVSGLFTSEFYGRVQQYLTDDGIFAQWMHLYEISDGLVLSVLAALHQNFPSYDVYLTAGGDMMIVASKRPELPKPDWSVFAYPGVMEDTKHLLAFTPDVMDATLLASRRDFAPMLDDYGQANSDYYPLLDLGAERSRFLRDHAAGFSAIGDTRLNSLDALFGRRRGFATDPYSPVPSIPRVAQRALGAAMREPQWAAADLSAVIPEIQAARMRRWEFDKSLAADRPPPDWPLWFETMMAVERDMHAGTSGVVDEPFYGQVFAFMARHGAPASTRNSVRLVHAFASWDFQTASLMADSLVMPVMYREAPLPAGVLRSTGTVAKLRTGDVAGARRFFDSLRDYARGTEDDLRFRIISAHLLEAEKRLAPAEQANASLPARKEAPPGS